MRRGRVFAAIVMSLAPVVAGPAATIPAITGEI